MVDAQQDLEQVLKVKKRRRRRSPVERQVRRVRRRLNKLANWRLIAVSAIVALIVIVIGGLALAVDANNRVRESMQNLNRVATTLNTKPGTELTLTDFDRLEASVNDAQRNLRTARRQTFFMRPFAPFNADLGAIFDALDASNTLTLAATDMLAGLRPTIFFMVEGDDTETVATQISSGQRIVELLRVGRGRFLSAENHLAQSRADLDAIDIGSISPDLLLDVESLADYHGQLEEINGLLLQMPDLLTLALGIDNTRSYLILAQNSDELRPSGGYISTYGWMTVRNGRVVDYNYNPTTTTSPNPPPLERADEVEVPEWWLQYRQPIYAAWDGSWHVDFPATADMARWYYDAGQNPESPVDGVFAIDIYGFEYLLEALGSVAVPGYDVVVTPDNFRELVYDIRAFGQGVNPHKEFVAEIYQQIFSNWQTVSQDQTVSEDLLGATLQALQERHIMLYFAEEDLNQAVDILEWSGAMEPARSNDYLMVADANLGNKSNRSVLRQTTYDVTIAPDGSLQSRVAIAYDYSDAVARQDPAVDAEYHGQLTYNNLLQVITPVESTLQDTNIERQIQRAAEDAHTIFAARLTIPYDSSERYQLSYTTPPLIERFGPYERYRLLLQKQPGMPGELVNVQVILPPGATIVSTDPEPAANYNIDSPILEFRIDLTKDQWIDVIYSE